MTLKGTVNIVLSPRVSAAFILLFPLENNNSATFVSCCKKVSRVVKLNGGDDVGFRHVLVDSALHLREAPLEVVAARRAAAASSSCHGAGGTRPAERGRPRRSERSLPLAAAAATAAASSLSLGLSLRARNPTGRPAGAARPLPASAARPAGVRPGASGAHGRRAGQNTETKSAERPV